MMQPPQIERGTRPVPTDLPQETTAVVLHWPECCEPICLADRAFIFPGIYGGEALHQRIDALIEEHAPRSDAAPTTTEVSVFWHLPDGRWEMEEFLSHFYA